MVFYTFLYISIFIFHLKSQRQRGVLNSDILVLYLELVSKVELVSKELNHLAAILHVYAGVEIW